MVNIREEYDSDQRLRRISAGALNFVQASSSRLAIGHWWLEAVFTPAVDRDPSGGVPIVAFFGIAGGPSCG